MWFVEMFTRHRHPEDFGPVVLDAAAAQLLARVLGEPVWLAVD